MHIKVNTWHLRIFLQAYVHDRRWLDAGNIDPEVVQTELLEAVAYREFQNEYYQMSSDQRCSKAMMSKYETFRKAYEEAFENWHGEQEKIHTAKMSREVHERLNAGRMSLCPYFWSVVSALVFYYGFIRSTRPVRQAFGRMVPALVTALLILFGSGLVGGLGYGVYRIVNTVPSPSSLVASFKNEYREYKEDQKKSAEYSAQRALEHEAWEKAFPDSVELLRLQAEKNQQLLKEQEAHERAERWEGRKSEMKEFGALIAILIIGILSFGLALALIYWALRLFIWGIRFLVPILNPAVERLSFKNAPEDGLRAWLVREFRRLKDQWAGFRRFSKETYELIAAFAKAKKERVCPYLTIDL